MSRNQMERCEGGEGHLEAIHSIPVTAAVEVGHELQTAEQVWQLRLHMNRQVSSSSWLCGAI